MRTETTAKVSVIVPVHNAERWLVRCVDSIRRQTLSAIEIILVENGSTDGSAELCDAYAREDGRIRVLHLAHADLSGARNAGLAVARAKYVGFVDSDDYIEPDMFARLLDAAERCGAEMACCDFISEAEEAPQTVPDSEVEPQLLAPREALRELLLEELSPAVWTKLFDRRLFAERQFPDDYLFEDHRTVHHWIARCQRIARVAKPLYHYVQHGESICHTFSPLKHYHFFLANYDRYEFMRRHALFAGTEVEAAIYERLVRSCLWNFKCAAAQVRPGEFATPYREMRRALARMLRDNVPLTRRTCGQLWRIVRLWPLYYLTHFAFHNRR